jgi:hypothetical protein
MNLLKTNYKNIFLIMLILSFVSVFAISYSVVSAHGDEPTEAQSNPETTHEEDDNEAIDDHTEDAPSSQASYVYIAQPGCSLSLVARRSLQLYDESRDDIVLNNAQIIFAETNLVKELGSRWLNTGEEVTIEFTSVEKFAQSSQHLSQTSLDAWQAYANNANFDLHHISPVEFQNESHSEIDNSHSEQTDNKNHDKTSDEQIHEEDENEDDKLAGTIRTGSNKWWILLTALSLVLLWWVMNRQNAKK